MRRRASLITGCAALAAGLFWIPGIASATVYIGNNAYAGGGDQDCAITSVSMTNDATNLYVTMNFDNTDNGGSTLNPYLNYEIGFQDAGVGVGQTSVTNPYGEPIGISTGMYDWLSAYYNPPYTGADFYHWNGSALAQEYPAGLAEAYNDTLNASSVTVTIPLSSLGTGLVVGSTFNFDVWDTFGSGSPGPYGVLDNNNSSPVANEVWNAQPWNGAPYDSATDPDSTFASTTYTVTAVPEPASLGLFCMSGMALLLRRRNAK